MRARSLTPISTTSVSGARGEAVHERAVGRLGVAGDHREPGREAAVRGRGCLGERRRRHGGRDAGHELERDPGRGERLRLLAAAPEDEGVAALEPHHALPAPRGEHEQLLDGALRDARLPGALPHEEAVRPRREGEHVVGDERVAEHHAGAAAGRRRGG